MTVTVKFTVDVGREKVNVEALAEKVTGELSDMARGSEQETDTGRPL